jgi:hypothetical protein
MSKQRSTMKRAVLAAALAVGVSGLAHAADTTKAKNFENQNEYLQDQSTSMPAGSPPVDRKAAPADPVPKATGSKGEQARFKGMDKQLQNESTSMPAGTPPVNSNSVNADPPPNAQAEEKFLQKNSTP